MTFAKFLITTFFTEQLQWLLLRFYPRFERNLEQKQLQLSAINTWFSWTKWFAATKISNSMTNLLKERNSWDVCFGILNFTKWFCCATYFVKVFLLLLFFSLKQFYNVFYTSRWDIIITWSLRLLLKVWIWCRYQNRI